VDDPRRWATRTDHKWMLAPAMFDNHANLIITATLQCPQNHPAPPA
jgi:hypothetical protein